jgi:hypothetical protein
MTQTRGDQLAAVGKLAYARALDNLCLGLKTDD